MGNKKAGKTLKKAPRDAIDVHLGTDGDVEKALARTTLQPTVQAARTLYLSQGDQHTVKALTYELAAIARTSIEGSTERSESMLMSQAHVLDELFHVLTRRALMNFKETYLDAGERYLRLALKAQSQARTTLETLATVKNPPIFARQANIAHGPQQVNNGGREEADAHACARKNENVPNELLEHKPNEWLDARAASETICGNQEVAPLAALDRPNDSRR